MIIYDLHALVDVNKSESDSKTGRSVSYALSNQSVYVFAVTREPLLLRQFCEEAQFLRTRREEEELEKERRMAEELLKCVKCSKFYTEIEN